MLTHGVNTDPRSTHHKGKQKGKEKFCKVLIGKQGKMRTQEFKKQIASNLFENAIHTSQAKQSAFFVVVCFLVVFFFSLLTQFYSETKIFQGRKSL